MPIVYGVKVDLVSGYYITALFCITVVIAAAMNKSENLNQCAPSKFSSKIDSTPT